MTCERRSSRAVGLFHDNMDISANTSDHNKSRDSVCVSITRKEPQWVLQTVLVRKLSIVESSGRNIY